jgi:hypothetical protein
MKRSSMMLIAGLVMLNFITAPIFAQSQTESKWLQAKQAPIMQWSCPKINSTLAQIKSLSNNDDRVYATNILKRFGLSENLPASTAEMIIQSAVFTTDAPLFKPENLLNHIAAYLKKQTGWGKEPKINLDKLTLEVNGDKIKVGGYSSFLDYFRASVSPTLLVQIIDGNKLIITMGVGDYLIEDRSNSQLKDSYTLRVIESFPCVEKGKSRNTCASAFVGTYGYIWEFFSKLINELNEGFVRDQQYLKELHYDYACDSLNTKYGSPTSIIKDPTAQYDVDREMRFYEDAQKVVYMGKTINFKDIMSCFIDDDVSYTPTHISSSAAGISIFGFGIGGSETTVYGNSKRHNYVVKIDIDNLSTPHLYLVTGSNAGKANEIAASFDYILRHQKKASQTSKTQTATRKSKR